MIIAGYGWERSQGYIYVRAEYPLAIKRLQTAIREARRLGFLGSQICSAKFSFDVEIRIGAVHRVRGRNRAHRFHRRPAGHAAASTSISLPVWLVGNCPR